MKKEFDEEELTNCRDDTFYINVEWVSGDKKKVLDWCDFDENEMADVPLDELDLKDTSTLNYDISRL